MSSYDPLLQLEEQSNELERARSVGFAKKAVKRDRWAALRDRNRLKGLEDLALEAHRLAKGDDERAEMLLKLAAKNKLNIDDPRTEMARLRAAVVDLAEAGAMGDLQEGRLPLEIEPLARMDQPWQPTTQMQAEAKLKGQELPETIVGAPSKTTENDALIDRALGWMWRAPTGVITGNLQYLKDKYKKEIEQDPSKAKGEIVIGGVPLFYGYKNLLQEIKDPNQLVAHAEAMTKGMTSNVKEGESSPFDVSNQLKMQLQQYFEQYGEDAFEEAAKQIKAEEDEKWNAKQRPVWENEHERLTELIDRAKNIVIQRSGDKGALLLKHPDITKFVTESVFDISNIVGPGIRAAGMAAKGTKLEKAVIRAKEILGDIKPFKGASIGEGFSSDYNINKLRKLGPAGEEAAAMLAIAEPQARYQIQKKIDELINGPIAELETLTQSDFEKDVVDSVVRQIDKPNIPLELANDIVDQNESLKRAVQLNREIEQAHKDLRLISGKGRVWSKTPGAETPITVENEFYGAPRRITSRPEDKKLGTWKVEGARSRTFKTGSDFARREGAEIEYPADPNTALQWKTELQDFYSSAEKSRRLKLVDATLKKKGLLLEVKSDLVNKAAQRLSAASDFEWKPLSETLRDTWQRITGVSGKTIKGKEEILIPAPVWDHIQELVIATEQKDPNKVAKFLEDSWGLLNRTWAKGMTVLWPGFHEMQIASNVMMTGLATGAKAFSPKTLLEGGKGAFANAFKDPKFAKSWNLTMANGDKISAYDAIQLGRETGVLSPPSLLDIDFYRGSEAITAPAKAERAIGKVLDPAMRLSKAEDDAFKLSVFMNFLDGKKIEDAAIAAQKASEFIPNYNKLGKWERDVLTNIVPYYGWMQFAAGRTLKSIITQPDRLAPYLKVQSAFESSEGENAPYPAEAVPSWVRGKGATAPYSLQPPEQQKLIDEALQKWIGAGKPGLKEAFDENGNMTPQFSMLVMDTPHVLGAPFAAALAGNDPVSVKDFLFPAANAVVELLLGREMQYYTPIERFPDEAVEFEATPFGRMGQNYTGRFSRAAENIYNLLTDSKTRLDFRLKMAAANDLGYLGRKAINLYGNLTEGENLVPDLPFGTRGVVSDPELTALRERQRKTEEAESYKKNVKRSQRGR